jgi:hypothetical protein
LKDCSREHHHFDNIHCGAFSEVEEDEEKVDFVLNKLAVVKRVFLITLTEIAQHDKDSEDLQHIHNFLPLGIPHFENLIKPFSLFLRIKFENGGYHVKELRLFE